MKFTINPLFVAFTVLLAQGAHATTTPANNISDAISTVTAQSAQTYQDEINLSNTVDFSQTVSSSQYLSALATVNTTYAQASASTYNGGSVLAIISPVGFDPYGSGAASSQLTYQFMFSGPSNELVPFSITSIESAFDTSSYAGGTGFASTNVSGGGISFDSKACWANGCQYLDNVGAFTSSSGNFVVESNTLVNVALNASVSNFYNGNTEQSITAYADPIIAISSTFADASDFILVESPEISDSPQAVPEPTTWAMMLAGLGLVGLTMRKRTRSSFVLR